MKKVLLALITIVVCLSFGGNVAHADGMILPEVLSPDYLGVRYHRVTVEIRDNHAVTRVEQEFYNPHPMPVSGRYLFPIPPDAILSGFRAVVDGRPQVATRQDGAQTNAMLYQTLRQRHDPSLLEYVNWDTWAFDLPEVPAGGSRRMVLEYEEALVPAGGMIRYHYVLGTERYSALPLEEVSVRVDLHLSSGIATLYSPSHPVTTSWQGPSDAQVWWEDHDVQPTEDYQLFFSPAEGDSGAGLLTSSGEGYDHFLFFFSPTLDRGLAPETNRAGESAIPKEIVFVMDRSGSMAGEKIEQTRNALHYILDQLAEQDRFSIVGFDDALSMFSPTLQPVEEGTITGAHRFVDRLAADGWTDLSAALQAGLAILGRSEQREASSMIVFLTDGLPTAGVTDEALIADLVAQANSDRRARLHVFGVGYDVNTHLLDRLAAGHGGTVTYVQPGENLEAVLSGFYDRIAYPVLTDVRIEFEGLVASDLYPQQIPDLFRGSPQEPGLGSLLLTGRYRDASDTVTVRVRGSAAGREQLYSYTFDLSETEDQAWTQSSAGLHWISRLWATRRAGDLMDRVRVEGETEALVAEIRELGLSYGLITPYTTTFIEAQADGAASAANMALYANQAQLNASSGRITIQARVQNQQYQQAQQAGLAAGANVVNSAQYNLAAVAGQNIDLRLLQTGRYDPNTPITAEWLERNVRVDLTIDFGSEAYFRLAEDPAVRPLLQSGPNVLLSYQGQVIAIRDASPAASDATGEDTPSGRTAAAQPFGSWVLGLLSSIRQILGGWF